MEIKYNTNGESPEEISITGPGNDWGIRGDKLWVTVDKVNVTPYSEDECIASVFGEGVKCLTYDIISVKKEINTLKAENESLKETIEALQRQLEKEKNKRDDMTNAFKTELEQAKKEQKGVDNDRDALDARTYSVLPITEHADNTNPDPELYTAMKILIARHNETLMENNRLRKRNEKLRQDFESIKGHLRVAQHKLDKYERDKHYSEMFVANHPGQSICFKDAKVSVSDNGDVTVSGWSVENLIDRLDGLIDTEARFTEWQNIVLKQVETNPGIFNEHIKEN